MKDYKAMWGAMQALAKEELGSAQMRVLTATPDTFLQAQGRWLQMQWVLATMEEITERASDGALPEKDDD